MTEYPSHAAEIDAMLAALDASEAHVSPDTPAPPAGTDGPVPVDGEHVASGELRESLTALRDYVDNMEHVRQNRLRRWQAPPDTTRSERATWRT